MSILLGDGPSDGPSGPPADLIKDVTTATFMEDVIEASKTIPVIVDFWADWCGPCKQLGPMLEKLVRQYAGKVKLAKVDADANQPLAKQLRIQSLPAVHAFKDGRPVDSFMGAVPESQVKQFIERLTGGGGSQLDEMLAEAENYVAEGQAETAMALYQEVLSQEPGHVRALAGALNCLLAMGQEDQARDVLAKLPDKIKLAPEIASIVTQLELKDATADAGDPGHVAELEAKVAAEPKNMDARMELAMAYYGANTREKAVEALLEMVAMDRKWNDEAARKQLVKLFEAFGPKDPLTAQGRRRLSSLLFS